MLIFWGIFGTILTCIIGYLIGSFNFSIFITRVFYHIDIRQLETKNPGANNVRLVLNRWLAGLVLLLDGLKVVVVMFLAVAISFIKSKSADFGYTSYYVAGLFTIIGHCLPVFYHFRGGKGVSCFFGFILMINPIIFLMATIIWWTIFLWKRKVLLASSTMMIILFFIVWLPWLSFANTVSWDFKTIIDSKILWFNQFHKYNNSGYYDNFILIYISFDLSILFIMLINIFWNKINFKNQQQKLRRKEQSDGK